MKFVSKLSVISLIVLMFSFMNVANAADAKPQCQGTSVSACSKIKDQAQCANNYIKNRDGSHTQCKWGTYCYNGGATCGLCPTGEILVGGLCVTNPN